MFPDSLGYIFSGSAVVDRHNTSGFGTEGKVPVVAFYTSHDPDKAEAGETDVESQSIAYSLDQGMTWTKYENNPVIPNAGVRDFRDPKVSWDPVHEQWNMVLAAGQEIRFYKSNDLKNWEELSSFGQGVGGHGGVWECPDLIQLPVEGSDETKWVLLVSINPGGPNGGSATQYFVGEFDGTEFRMDKEFANAMKEDHRFWIDHGRDNYAGVTWSGIPETDGRKIFIGWMSNWDYAQEVPTETWRSAMTIPRSLHLYKDDTYILANKPLDELNNRLVALKEFKSLEVKGEKVLAEGEIASSLDQLALKFTTQALPSDTLSFRLSNEAGEYLDLGYIPSTSQFYIDRRASGENDFSEEFAPGISTAPRHIERDTLAGVLYFDKTSVEAFYDEGRSVMTELFFPSQPWNKISVTATNDGLKFQEIGLYTIEGVGKE